jgi:DNA-binding response OmpR family regulator
MRILIVEDDSLLGDALQRGLRQAGFAPDWLRDGQSAAHALAVEPYQAVVLDLGLPRLGGMQLLRQMRGRDDRTPVLVLTARDRLEDRVAGLDAGADDYLVKPVELAELAARLRALLRRSRGDSAPTVEVGELKLDPAGHRAWLADAPLELTAREFALLLELASQAGRVLSREQLEARLYEWDQSLGSNAIEVHVHHLRKKLGADRIRTVRGVGYLMPRAS